MYRYLIALALLMTWGCQQNPEGSIQTDEHDHAHSGESLQYTLFNENAEFFIEHEPLEAGEESEFLVHTTRLDTYKPYHSGNVTIEIDGVSVTSGNPHQPGIFHVPFIPRKAGAFHLNISLQTEGSVEQISGHVHVEDHEEDLANAGSGHAHEPAPLGEIIFLKEQAWQSDFRVDEVLNGAFHTVILTSGEFMPMPGEKKNITATTRGMVHFTNPQLVQGADVERGQLLFTISSENLVEDNLNVRYQAAKNKLEKSRGEYYRHKGLYQKEVISERQYVESQSIYVEDSLNYYNLEAHVSDDGIRIVAQASGSLHELGVSDGMYVTEGTILAILSPDRNLMLRADLPQHYFNYSHEITTAHFRPAYSDQVLSVDDLQGKLLATGHSVKENDHYLPVNFLLKNNGSLLEGAFAEVYLIAGIREQVISIPTTALGEEQGGKYVFVQVSGESYSKRRITIGDIDGRRVEVLVGLQTGERVVTRGTMLVKAASLDTGEIIDGHSH
ncbi:MAG: efflux RND transporter periplasmic adaptor subunit [Bacteroidetes bacterium]|nr:efflux RND transporter periplasmic adaptor subunit [Bacteroidota bacterium]